MKHVHRTRRGPLVRAQHGFSLLEMVLAIGVFALMAATAYGVVNSIVAAATAQETVADKLRQVQLATVRLERELGRTVSAGMFATGSLPAGLQGAGDQLEFVYLSPDTIGAGAALRRVRYVLDGGALLRVPLSAAASPMPAPESRVLLHGVSGLALTYLHPDLGWVAGWDDSAPGDLPLAVRVVIDIEGFGRLERVVELPGDRS